MLLTIVAVAVVAAGAFDDGDDSENDGNKPSHRYGNFHNWKEQVRQRIMMKIATVGNNCEENHGGQHRQRVRRWLLCFA
jgi:hypothetical protein